MHLVYMQMSRQSLTHINKKKKNTDIFIHITGKSVNLCLKVMMY